MPRTASPAISGMVKMNYAAAGARFDDVQQRRRSPTSTPAGTSDEPEHGHWSAAPGRTRFIEVAQQQPVPDADDEAGSEDERPIMNHDERLADGDERVGICTRRIPPQRHN